MTTENSNLINSKLQAPSFRPEEALAFVLYWPEKVWKIIKVEMERRPSLRLLRQLLYWLGIAYIILVWICASYISFPISPYSMGDIIGWALISALLLLAAFFLFIAIVNIALVLWLILLIILYLTLSLAYLSWVIWNAKQKKSSWLKPYRSIIIISVILAIALAIFADGAYRFWDSPFDWVIWGKFAFLGLSGWATLFCILARDRVYDAETPSRILKWTIILTIGLGVLAYWHSGSERESYFLHKSVVEHPDDKNAWIDLGLYYNDIGNKYANDQGDEDHEPPNPIPHYREALRCLDKAVELGATGYAVHYMRASLAEKLGKNQDAVTYCKTALAEASLASSDDREEVVKWLNEMIERNNTVPSDEEPKKNREIQVRKERIKTLPEIVRWAVEYFE